MKLYDLTFWFFELVQGAPTGAGIMAFVVNVLILLATWFSLAYVVGVGLKLGLQ